MAAVAAAAAAANAAEAAEAEAETATAEAKAADAAGVAQLTQVTQSIDTADAVERSVLDTLEEVEWEGESDKDSQEKGGGSGGKGKAESEAEPGSVAIVPDQEESDRQGEAAEAGDAAAEGEAPESEAAEAGDAATEDKAPECDAAEAGDAATEDEAPEGEAVETGDAATEDEAPEGEAVERGDFAAEGESPAEAATAVAAFELYAAQAVRAVAQAELALEEARLAEEEERAQRAAAHEGSSSRRIGRLKPLGFAAIAASMRPPSSSQPPKRPLPPPPELAQQATAEQPLKRARCSSSGHSDVAREGSTSNKFGPYTRFKAIAANASPSAADIARANAVAAGPRPPKHPPPPQRHLWSQLRDVARSLPPAAGAAPKERMATEAPVAPRAAPQQRAAPEAPVAPRAPLFQPESVAESMDAMTPDNSAALLEVIAWVNQIYREHDAVNVAQDMHWARVWRLVRWLLDTVVMYATGIDPRRSRHDTESDDR
jgi:hypothetical protein